MENAPRLATLSPEFFDFHAFGQISCNPSKRYTGMNFADCFIKYLYNNQINARALIGQSAVGYCYYKPTENLRVF